MEAAKPEKRQGWSTEVLIAAELLVDLFRAGNVLEERIVDVIEGIPADAQLQGVSLGPHPNEVILHLDQPSPTPMLRWRQVGDAHPNGRFQEKSAT